MPIDRFKVREIVIITGVSFIFYMLLAYLAPGRFNPWHPWGAATAVALWAVLTAFVRGL